MDDVQQQGAEQTGSEAVQTPPTSMLEWKTQRAARDSGTATETQTPNPDANPNKGEPKGPSEQTPKGASGSGQESETGKPEAQGQDRSAAGRARQLVAEGRIDEAVRILQDAAGKGHEDRFTRLEQELQTLRAKPAEPAKDQPKPDDSGKPSLKEFLKAAKPGEEYEDVHERYLEARDAWSRQQSERQAEERKQTEQAGAFKTNLALKVAELKADPAYQDYDEVTRAGVAAQAKVANTGIAAAVPRSKNPAHVLYALCKNAGAEYARIAALEPDEAFAEIIRLDQGFTAKATPAPPKPQAPVSRAPKPATPIGGNDAPGSSAKDAPNMDVYKQRRRAEEAARAARGA